MKGPAKKVTKKPAAKAAGISPKYASIRSYAVPYDQVETTSGIIRVRGLGFHDIATVFLERKDEMASIYSSIMAETFVVADRIDAIYSALMISPILVAKLIATACDDPEGWEFVMHMTLGDQAVMAEKILALTFANGVQVGNVLGAVSLAARNAKQAKSP